MIKRLTLKIARIETETKNVKTFHFSHKLEAEPGQFIMVTDYENGEKPFSLSICELDHFAITVKRIGDFTNQLFQKKCGDYLSIRGPYGSSFFVSKKKVLLVGGGCAVPTLYFLSKRLLSNNADVTLINGAKTKDELIFVDKFHSLFIQEYFVTDDGSFGEKATSVQKAEEILKTDNFSFVYASGPELMLFALKDKLKKINYEFLLERYMKCAIGVCGSCTIDPLGIRMCVEGPVLNREKIEKLTEFGHYHRDASGKRIGF